MPSIIPFCTSLALNSMRTSIACPLNDAPVMQSDGRAIRPLRSGPSPAKCPLHVGSCQLATSGYSCRENCSEFLVSAMNALLTSQTTTENLRGGRGANLTARFRRVPESPDLDWLRVDFLVRRDA